MFYKMNIAGLERELPLCALNDDLYIAGFVMFSDVEITEACAKALLEKAPEDFDVIVTAESKGIPLAYEMARQSGKNYVVHIAHLIMEVLSLLLRWCHTLHYFT